MAVLPLVGFAFVASTAVGEWSDVARTALQVTACARGEALLAVVACFLCLCRSSHVLLLASRSDLTFSAVAAVFFLSNIGKYIPGKVFMAVSRVGELSRLGVSTRAATALLVLEIAVFSLAAMCIGVWLLPVASHVPWLAEAVLTVILCGLIALAVVWRRLVGFRQRVRDRVLEVVSIGGLSWLRIGSSTLWAALGWVFYGAGAWVIAHATGSADLDLFPAVSASMALSWLIGFLAVIAPGGLGIREASVVATLSTSIGPGPALAVAVEMRLVWIVVEVVGWAVATSTRSWWETSSTA